MVNIWETLGIERTSDEAEIKKAYAARIRIWRPDTDPENFARLREAYEMAQGYARNHVELEDEPDKEPEDADPPIAQPLTRPRPAAEPAPPRAPTAEERGQQLVRDLVRTYREQGEQAAVATLGVQLSALRSESVDTRLAWEAALVYSFVGDEAPPLGLLFEADLRLGWSEHGHDQGARRLYPLLEAAHMHAYATRFSPNRWEARLFDPGSPSWIGLGPWMRSAARTYGRWVQACELAGAEGLVPRANPATLKRLDGRAVLSTDFLLALCMCWTFSAFEWVPAAVKSPAQIWGFYVALFVAWSLLPALARFIKVQPLTQRVRARAKPLGKVRVEVIAIALGVVLIGSAIASDAIHPLWVRVIGWTFLGTIAFAFVTFLATAAWYCVAFLEAGVLRPLAGVQDLWGRHRFERFKQRARHDEAQAGFRADLAAFPSALTRRFGQTISRRLRTWTDMVTPFAVLIGFMVWITYYLTTIRPWFMKEVLQTDSSYGLLELLHVAPIVIVPLMAIGLVFKVAEGLGLRKPR